MVVVIMKDENNKMYNNVVVENFLKYLKKKGITQKKYAQDNNMDKSIPSKWKKGDSSPTLDQVMQAAKYFEITVNDLVYSEKEKKKIQVLADKSYDPIIAKQSLKITLYKDIFKKPGKVIILCFFLFFLLLSILYILREISLLYILIFMLYIPYCIKIINNIFTQKKTYIVNYLDDIFYQRDNKKNSSYIWSIIIRTISFFQGLYYVTLYIGIDFSQANKIQKGLLVALLFMLIFLIFSIFFSIIELPKKFKLEIYDNEFQGYYSTIFILLVQFVIVSIFVRYVFFEFLKYYPYLIMSIFALTINILDFIMISREYSKYMLVYKENDKEPRELFPEKN